MSVVLIRSLITVILMAAFIGLVFWAWSKNRKADFEAAANIPLQEDDRPGSATGPGKE